MRFANTGLALRRPRWSLAQLPPATLHFVTEGFPPEINLAQTTGTETDDRQPQSRFHDAPANNLGPAEGKAERAHRGRVEWQPPQTPPYSIGLIWHKKTG